MAYDHAVELQNSSFQNPSLYVFHFIDMKEWNFLFLDFKDMTFLSKNNEALFYNFVVGETIPSASRKGVLETKLECHGLEPQWAFGTKVWYYGWWFVTPFY